MIKTRTKKNCIMYNFLSKTAVFFVFCTTIGCSTYHAKPAPDSVALMPMDCANETALTNWLQDRIDLPQPIGMTDREYENAISYHKNALWNLRYHCGRSQGTYAYK